MEYLILLFTGISVAGFMFLLLSRFYTKHEDTLKRDFARVREKFSILFPGKLFIFLSIAFVVVGFTLSWFFAPIVFIYPLIEKVVKERIWRKKVERMEAQLVDFLNFYASSIKAGASLLQGFESAVKASPDPLASSLKPVVDEVRMGRKLGEAVIDWAKKIESREGYIIGTSLTIFQETGGNLTEVLMKIAELVKRRIALRNKVDSLTAMGRLQAIVMVILGPFVAFIVAAMAPEMFNAALKNAISIFLFIVAAGLELLAIVIMRRLMKVEY